MHENTQNAIMSDGGLQWQEYDMTWIYTKWQESAQTPMFNTYTFMYYNEQIIQTMYIYFFKMGQNYEHIKSLI